MSHRRATGTLVLVTVLWGMNFPAIKAVFTDVSPLLAVGIRFGTASLLLSPLLPGITRRELLGGLVIGALFATGVAFQNVGLAITTPSRSAFIVALSALITPAVAAGLFRHRVPGDVVLRLLAALGGVYLLTAPSGSLSGVNRGDLLTLVAAGVYAGHILAVGHFAIGSSAARIVAVQFAVTSLVGWVGAVAVEHTYFHLTPRVLGLFAFLITTSLVTFSLQLRAQRVVSPSEAALVFTFEPVVAAMASFVVFGERLSLVQLIGGGMIMLAVGIGGRTRGRT